MHTRPFVRLALALLVTIAASLPVFAQKAPQTATQFYMSYRAAFEKAKTVDEIAPYMAAKNRAQMEATPKDERAKMFELIKMMNTLTDVKVLKETRGADGGATLAVEALDSDKKKTTGTIDVVKEGGEWKIGKESFKSGS